MAAPGLHLVVKCKVCAKEYRQSRNDQVYCSGRCASSAWRTKNYAYKTLKCKKCGCDFPRKYSSQKFCSTECRLACEAASRKRVGGPGKGWSKGAEYAPRRPCQLCGKLFYAPPAQMRRGGGKFCSTDCRGRHMATNPHLFPHTNHKRGRGGKRDDLGGAYFRSRWEANWARYLNWLQANGNIKSWTYETETYEFTAIKRGSRWYTPDFIVVENDDTITRYELKGYMDPASKTKLKRMAKYYPEAKITVIDKKAYYAVAHKIATLIPGWESDPNFRR